MLITYARVSFPGTTLEFSSWSNPNGSLSPGKQAMREDSPPNTRSSPTPSKPLSQLPSQHSQPSPPISSHSPHLAFLHHSCSFCVLKLLLFIYSFIHLFLLVPFVTLKSQQWSPKWQPPLLNRWSSMRPSTRRSQVSPTPSLRLKQPYISIVASNTPRYLPVSDNLNYSPRTLQ